MEYSFDEICNRRGTGSLKWDIPQGELPMWVADMDFKTAPCVVKALEKRVQEGIFGYHIIPDEWYQAYSNWWKKRYQFSIQKDWLIFCTGVVPAITSAVKRITNVGDQVLVQTPVYDIFFHSIENTGRHVLESPLLYNGEEYEIDFNDLEEKLAQPLTTMMILCNPHNPVGKIWTREELDKIGALCKKHDVVVLSDEIHCDLTEPGCRYIPFASVSKECLENSITCIAASKAFNLAGLQSAAVVVPGKALYNKINRGFNSDEIAEPNAFAIPGTVAALTEGEPWLEELRTYVAKNKKDATSFIANNISVIKPVASKATYLLWVDCSKITQDTTSLCQYLREKHKLFVSVGANYRGNGKQFIRINLACPHSQMEEGMKRLQKGIYQFMEQK